jgi:hypothetical protein
MARRTWLLALLGTLAWGFILIINALFLRLLLLAKVTHINWLAIGALLAAPFVMGILSLVLPLGLTKKGKPKEAVIAAWTTVILWFPAIAIEFWLFTPAG